MSSLGQDYESRDNQTNIFADELFRELGFRFPTWSSRVSFHQRWKDAERIVELSSRQFSDASDQVRFVAKVAAEIDKIEEDRANRKEARAWYEDEQLEVPDIYKEDSEDFPLPRNPQETQQAALENAEIMFHENWDDEFFDSVFSVLKSAFSKALLLIPLIATSLMLPLFVEQQAVIKISLNALSLITIVVGSYFLYQVLSWHGVAQRDVGIDGNTILDVNRWISFSDLVSSTVCLAIVNFASLHLLIGLMDFEVPQTLESAASFLPAIIAKGAFFDLVESFDLFPSYTEPALNQFAFNSFEFVSRLAWGAWTGVLLAYAITEVLNVRRRMRVRAAYREYLNDVYE